MLKGIGLVESMELKKIINVRKLIGKHLAYDNISLVRRSRHVKYKPVLRRWVCRVLIDLGLLVLVQRSKSCLVE